jgi:hypothetical protein
LGKLNVTINGTSFYSVDPFSGSSVENTFDISALEEGEYELIVELVDKAGNADSSIRSLIIDRTSPVFIDLTIDSGNLYGDTCYGAGSIDFTAVLEGNLDYLLIEQILDGEIVYSRTVNGNYGDSENTVSATVQKSSSDGEKTTLKISACDTAGNLAEYVLPEEILWDTSSPQISVSDLQGRASAYFSELSDIRLEYVSSDEHSFISENQIGIREADSVYDYTWAFNIEDLVVTLQEGGIYELAVRSVNRAGLSVITKAGELTFVDGSMNIGSIGFDYPNRELGLNSIASGDTFSLDITLDEYAGFIEYYEINIGSTLDPLVISGSVDGNTEGILTWTSSNGLITLPDVENDTYSIVVTAYNQYGESVSQSGDFTVNNDIERIIVSALGSVVSSTSFNMSLEYIGAFEPGSEYSWSLFEKGSTLISGSSDWGQITFDSAELGLINGGSYYFSFKTMNSNSETVESRSQIFIYDTTKPEITINSVPAYSRNMDLYVDFTAVEDACSVKKVAYRIEKLEDGIFTVISDGWISQPVEGDSSEITERIKISDSSLNTDDSVRIALRAVNAGFLMSNYVYSGLIVIVNEFPESPLVVDEGQYTNLGGGLSFSYVYSDSSDIDRIEGASHALLYDSYNTEGASWTGFDISGSGEFSFSYTAEEILQLNGKTAVLAVRTTGLNGLESISYSNGIIVDTEAPDILNVELNNHKSGSLAYIEDFDEILFSITAGDDKELGFLSYQLGMYNGNNWTAVDGATAKQIAYSAGEIQYNDTDNIKDADYDGEIFSMKIEVSDEAENISYPGFSGLIKMVSEPLVTISRPAGWIASIEGSEYLYFTWNHATNLPVDSGEIVLKKDGSDTGHSPDFISNNIVYYASESFEDGSYTIEVTLKDVLDNTYSAVSNTVVLDNSAPVLKDMDVSRFVSYDMKYSLTVDENLSDISEVFYAIGNSCDPLAVSHEWIMLGDSSSLSSPRLVEYIDETIDLDSTKLNEGNELILTFRAVNTRGLVNQQPLDQSSIVDLSFPLIAYLSVPEYTRAFDTVGIAGKGSLEIALEDDVSGLDYYQFALSEDPDSLPESLEWNTAGVPVTDDLTSEFSIENLPCRLDDSKEYYIFTRAVNGARMKSDVSVSSGIVRSDFTPPEVSFNLDTGQFDLAGRYVANDAGEYAIPFSHVDNSLDIWVDSVVTVNEISVITEDGISQNYYSNEAYWTGNTFAVDVVDELQKRDYTVRVSTVDEAGNTNDCYLNIRFNVAPEMALNPEVCLYTGDNLYIPVTPGKPVNLADYLLYTDLENYSLDTYNMDLKSQALSPVDLTTVVEDGSQSVAFIHNDPENAVYTDFNIIVSAVDEFGKESLPSNVTVRVRNTEAGILYTDEYWQEGHRITGDIFVDSGLKLVVRENAEVEAVEIDESCGFTVTVAGELVLEDGSYIHKEKNNGSLWGGFLLKGDPGDPLPEASIYNSKISYAERGLTIASDAVVSLTGTVFDSNQIGLHMLVGSFDFYNLSFTGNSQYGIKEDGTANPGIIGSTFNNNLYDYYDTDLTAISYEELNTFGRNNGNEGN